MVTGRSPPFRERRRENREASRAIWEGLCDRWNIRIRQSPISLAHADETGIQVEEMLRWLHVATTELYTYLFVPEKQGRVALESEQSVLDELAGWLVHDCWGSYFNFNDLQHALCGKDQTTAAN